MSTLGDMGDLLSFITAPTTAFIGDWDAARSRLHTGVHHMPQAYNRSDPSLLPIERPRCPKCQGRMTLAQIEQGPGGADLRTFECPKCEHVQKMLVVEDPLKSANTGWTAGGLRPPT
jgi:hypothetical protein